MVAAGFCHTVLLTTLAGDEEERVPTPPPPVVQQPAAGDAGGIAPPKKKRAEGSAGPPTKEKKKRPLLTLVVTIVSARNITAKDERGTSDPYCKVKVKDGRNKDKERTKVIKTVSMHRKLKQFTVKKQRIVSDSRPFTKPEIPRF